MLWRKFNNTSTTASAIIGNTYRLLLAH